MAGKDEEIKKNEDSLEDDIFTQYEFEEEDGKDEDKEGNDSDPGEKN